MTSFAVPVTRKNVARKLHSLLKTRRAVVVYTTLLLLFVGLVYFMPLPYNPLEPDPSKSLQAPSGEHWFGTDTLGR